MKLFDKLKKRNYIDLQLYAGGDAEANNNTFLLNKELEKKGYYKLSKNGFGKGVVIDGYGLELYIRFKLDQYKDELDFDSEAGCTFVYPKSKNANNALKEIKDKILDNPIEIIEELVTNDFLNQRLLNLEDIKQILSFPTQPQHQGEEISVDEINSYAVAMYNGSKYRKSLNAFSFGLNDAEVSSEDKAEMANNIAYLCADFATMSQEEELNLLAIDYYQKAIDLGFDKAHNNLAIVYYDMKQYEKALEIIEVACQQEEINAFNTKCNTLMQLDRKEEAKQALNDGIEVAKKLNLEEDVEYYNHRIINFDNAID